MSERDAVCAVSGFELDFLASTIGTMLGILLCLDFLNAARKSEAQLLPNMVSFVECTKLWSKPSTARAASLLHTQRSHLQKDIKCFVWAYVGLLLFDAAPCTQAFKAHNTFWYISSG